MKISKLIATVLSLAICLSFAGCAKNEEKSPTTSVKPLAHSLNIVGYAEKGEIPEIPYALGHDVENLKETFMSHIEEGSEIIELIVQEGQEDVWLLGGSMSFCYEKKNKDKGISVIIAQEYAYDFSMGGVYDADDVIYAVGLEEYQRAETTSEDAFFLPVIPENSECIKYSINGFDLRFILIDGYLSSVTLTNPENWK
ncbi:MAG: hypothetical protein IJD71_02840 [Clostridia bacterium]|nr:hypothetical protein [Clostridia bacterium]MBQ9919313.1 hypothetical protein [Clostridia bacterium]